MKKLFLFLLLAVFVFASGKAAFAQTQDTASSAAYIKYDLAYPGILPDNPLYKLKVLRERITEFLISNPRDKADYYLLQADKGILATAILIDKKKIDLAGTTALKAENNMTLLTYELYKLTQKPDSNFINKLKTASFKHQEVLKTIISRVAQDKQKSFIDVLNFSKTNLQTIQKFEMKKFYIHQ